MKKQIVLLGFVSLFTDLASEMLYPVAPIFLSTLGVTMAGVGIIEGIAEITAGLLKGYFGVLSDKLGKRVVFVRIGYALSAISKPLPGLMPGFISVLFSRTTDRIGKGVRTAPRDALIAGYSDGDTGALFGFHRAMDTLGAALGPVAALICLAYFPGNYRLIFLLAFIPSIIAVLFTFTVSDKQDGVTRQREEAHYTGFWTASPKEYKLIVTLLALFSLANSSDVFLILKSRQIAGSDNSALFGYILYNLVYASVSYPAGLIADRYGKKRVFIAGLIIFALVYLGFGLSENYYLLWALFVLYGFYAAATEGIAKAWVSDLFEDKRRGTAIGILSMTMSFAVMAGSIITGLLWDQFGSSVPFLLSSAVSLIIAVLLMNTRSLDQQ